MTTAAPVTLDDLLSAIVADCESRVDAPCLMCDGRLERVSPVAGVRLRCRSCGSALEDAVPIGVAA